MKNITLYHFSNADIKRQIKTSFYGENFYSKNDFNCTYHKRTFFYTQTENIEYIFKRSKYYYEVNYPSSLIYDLIIDKFNFKRYAPDIDKILSKIKQKYYKGVKYRIGNIEIVNLFYDIKFTKKKE